MRGAALILLSLALLPGAPRLAAQAPASPRDSALHALNRLAFGPAPGQVEAVDRERGPHLQDTCRILGAECAATNQSPQRVQDLRRGQVHGTPPQAQHSDEHQSSR